MRTVRRIARNELSTETAQTPHLKRFAAISHELVGSEAIWMGVSVLDPGMRTGVHHHGSSETALYVVKGVGRWWIGDRLDEPVEAGPGEFLYIPPDVVHWEQNASDTEPVEMIVARSTQEAIVVNLPDHPFSPKR